LEVILVIIAETDHKKNAKADRQKQNKPEHRCQYIIDDRSHTLSREFILREQLPASIYPHWNVIFHPSVMPLTDKAGIKNNPRLSDDNRGRIYP
jgi:hypothetical protein